MRTVPRAHEVAERRLEDVVVHDGPDVAGPVGGEQDGGDGHEPQDRAVASKDLEPRHRLVSERNTARSTNELTMRAPMSWNAQAVQRLPVDGQEPPDEVRRQPERDPAVPRPRHPTLRAEPSSPPGRNVWRSSGDKLTSWTY